MVGFVPAQNHAPDSNPDPDARLLAFLDRSQSESEHCSTPVWVRIRVRVRMAS